MNASVPYIQLKMCFIHLFIYLFAIYLLFIYYSISQSVYHIFHRMVTTIGIAGCGLFAYILH